MRILTGFIFGLILGLSSITFAEIELVPKSELDPCVAAVEDIARTVEKTLRNN